MHPDVLLQNYIMNSRRVAIAGHTSITTTQRYVHPQKVAIQNAIEEISGLKFVRSAKKRRLKVVGIREKVDV